MHRSILPTLCAAALAVGVAGSAAADHLNRSRPWWDHNVSRERLVPEAHRHHRDARPSWTCAPCRHRWTDYAAFAHHLEHHHHVPPWRIPALIVERGCGWVFYG